MTTFDCHLATDTKEPPDLFRAYLPTIRLKALLDCERQAVADLETRFRTYDLWMDAGLVSLAQRDQIIQELLDGRIPYYAVKTSTAIRWISSPSNSASPRSAAGKWKTRHPRL